MRVAVIADIHSNREALDSVLARIDQEGVDAILNLGDLVGYNASPNECLELLQGRQAWSLAGNHDLALLDPERAQNFNIIAYEALMWCRQQIRPEFLEFLQGGGIVDQFPHRCFARLHLVVTWPLHMPAQAPSPSTQMRP